MKTDFLDRIYKKVPERQRKWHIDNGIFEPILCKTCNENIVNWNVKDKEYRKYCSSKCCHADEEVKKKTETTCLRKYGAKTNLLSEDNRKKQRATCLANHGYENPFSSPEIISKIRRSNVERFGAEHATQNNEIKRKVDDTHQSRYGRKRKSQSHIPEDVVKLKNDVEMMRNWYYDLKIPVSAIAEILGVNHAQLCVHFRDNLGIVIKRHLISYPETQLLDYVMSICSDAIANDRSVIAPKELDIVIPSRKIAIEFNGLAWHTEARGRKHKFYHSDKTNLAAAAGYQLIHIFSNEWEDNPDLVKSRLKSKLGAMNSIYARSCEVKMLSHDEAEKFLLRTHIQGWAQSSVNLGLYHDGVLVAVMTFGKPRFNRKYQWELIRLASDVDVRIVGGAAKLFKFFLDHYEPKSVISYCDLRWNNGVVYQKMGFTKTHTTDPNYWYVSKNRFLHHRTQFQKHKLSEKLNTFDPSLTEWENMQANGYDRIWDCGNDVWVWSAGES